MVWIFFVNFVVEMLMVNGLQAIVYRLPSLVWDSSLLRGELDSRIVVDFLLRY